MTVLGINGSPRIGGNTERLLARALAGIERMGARTDVCVLDALQFAPCRECPGTRTDGRCIIEDDFQPLFDAVERADGLILASPIFFGSVSAQVKMMVDRFQCFWIATHVLNTRSVRSGRPAGFICVQATRRRDFFENARMVVANFFATAGFVCREELSCTGVEGQGEIERQPACLDRAFTIGTQIAIHCREQQRRGPHG